MITETTGVIAPIIENIPKGLTERRQWVLWRLEMRDDKPTKVPYTPAGYLASVTDLMSWSTFEAAIAAFEGRGYDGIGFVFSSGDPYGGIDLDKCRNPQTGELASWSSPIVDELASYAEVSASGTGVMTAVSTCSDACRV